jgi:hypothetical protein
MAHNGCDLALAGRKFEKSLSALLSFRHDRFSTED